MAKYEARDNLETILNQNSYRFLVNKGGVKNKFKKYNYGKVLIELSGNTVTHGMIVPHECSKVEEIDSIKKPLKELLQPLPSLTYDGSNNNSPIDLVSAYLGNQHAFQNKFYGFECGTTFLTDHLENLLSIMKNYTNIPHNIGLLRSDNGALSIDLARTRSPDIESKTPEIMDVYKWLKSHKTDVYNNARDNHFIFSHKGIILRTNGMSYYIIVGDGSDSDMVDKYLSLKQVMTDYKNNKPIMDGVAESLDGFLIATPLSNGGILFNDDTKALNGQQYTHTDHIQKGMPKFEYLKTSQYCRLPFIIPKSHSPLQKSIGFVVSEALNGGTDYPYISVQYFFHDHQSNITKKLHNFSRVSI